MSQHLLALDQGTSSSRSIVFDVQGRIVAMAQREFRQIYPQPGWVEHDPKEIWATQLATAQEALAKANLKASDSASIGITNQRETTLVWNRRTGEPVHNAIVWQDRRAEPTCAALRAQGLAPVFQRKTGLIIDAYFSGTKLKWILDHVPGARAAASKGDLAFGTVDTWLMWMLTGGRIIFPVIGTYAYWLGIRDGQLALAAAYSLSLVPLLALALVLLFRWFDPPRESVA